MKRAWDIEDTYEDGTDERVPAEAQLNELVSSLLGTLETIGGQVTIASKRRETGESFGDTRIFSTVGYLVLYTDRVPGLAAEEQPKPAPEPAAESGEGQE